MPPPLEVLPPPPAPPPPPVPLVLLALVPPRAQSGAVLTPLAGQQISALPPRSRELVQTRPSSQSSLPLSMLQR